MSLMLKLLAITALLSSLSSLSASSKKVEDFLTKTFSKNQGIKSLKVKVTNTTVIRKYNGWKAYFVSVDAELKKDGRKVNQKMVWFSDGNVVTSELFDVQNGADFKELTSLPFKDEYYNKANLIYGSENSKYKVVIFSDPLCPFCRKAVPEALNFMKKDPKKFAVYYYHFPLPSLHPAAVPLVKAAVALELKTGRKDIALDLYRVKVDAREKDINKVMAAFNKALGSNLKPEDIQKPEVLNHVKHDLDRADSLMVNGTPTMFFDGKQDKTKNKYKTAR